MRGKPNLADAIVAQEALLQGQLLALRQHSHASRARLVARVMAPWRRVRRAAVSLRLVGALAAGFGLGQLWWKRRPTAFPGLHTKASGAAAASAGHRPEAVPTRISQWLRVGLQGWALAGAAMAEWRAWQAATPAQGHPALHPESSTPSSTPSTPAAGA
jgi:hypothetical protein